MGSKASFSLGVRQDSLVCTLLLMTCAMANAAPVCRHEVQIDAIREALAHTRFVSYQPTALRIIDGKATHANEASIADDLTVLRSRFDGLITYGASSGAERVPDVAAALGYKAVIVGVWDPSSDEEVGKAIAAWGRHPQLVVGISLGNETVLGKRFDFESLGGAIGLRNQVVIAFQFEANLALQVVGQQSAGLAGDLHCRFEIRGHPAA